MDKADKTGKKHQAKMKNTNENSKKIQRNVTSNNDTKSLKGTVCYCTSGMPFNFARLCTCKGKADDSRSVKRATNKK
eukprot:1330954-Amphidinium_carterae.1